MRLQRLVPQFRGVKLYRNELDISVDGGQILVIDQR
jgi:hypothetical protein